MTIDQEFKELIPPLSADEYKQLEENILRDGIRDSLVIWDNNGEHILIDGHNRYEISQKHKLPYNIKRMTFADRDAVRSWIITNQLGRRNLPAFVRSELALRLKAVIAEKAKENVLASQKNSTASAHQKSDKQINTNKELAQVAGVSHDTIHKVETILDKGSPEMQEKCRSGEMSVNAAYGMIKAAEQETKRQKEAADLRAAEHRHEDFTEQKTEGVISLEDAKQDQEDTKLIYQSFREKVRLAGNPIYDFGNLASSGELREILKGAKGYELTELLNVIQKYHSNLVKMMRIISEVINEE